jgi:hypothetical protein
VLKGSVLVVLLVGLLAGCGGSSTRTVTVAAYGDHPATTISASYDAGLCRQDADEFASQSRAYLAHSGSQASYPADLWYVILREALSDFRARGCDPAVFRAAVDRQLTRKQLATLLADLPATMEAQVREAL